MELGRTRLPAARTLLVCRRLSAPDWYWTLSPPAAAFGQLRWLGA
jgi:hypothetical protein